MGAAGASGRTCGGCHSRGGHDGGGGSGTARRRRERRLRQHWRHEQLTLRMALATFQHHPAPRGQRMARAGGRGRGGGGYEMKYTAKLRLNPPPPGGWCGVLRDGHRGKTMVPLQPPAGQHLCWRCCRKRGRFGTRGSVTSWCSPPWCRSWTETARTRRQSWSSTGWSRRGAGAGTCPGPATRWG